MPQRDDDIRKIVIGGRARGLSDDQIRALVRRYDERAATPARPAQETIVTRMADALPVAGGMVGSAVGGVPGATLGGATGRGYGTLLRRAGEIPGAVADVARNLVTEPRATARGFLQGATEGAAQAGTAAAMQGALEGGGRMVGAGLKAAAPRLAQFALRPIKSVAQKYPHLGAAYVREGRLFAGKRGGIGTIGSDAAAKEAAALRTASRETSDAMLQAAEQTGAPPIESRKVLGELKRVAKKAAIRVNAGKADDRPAILARARAFVAKSPRLSLTKANVIRRELDDTANAAFIAARKGESIKQLEGTIDAALATGLRKRIKAGAVAAGQTQYPETVARTRDLAGLARALEDARHRSHALTQNLGMTAAAIGALPGIIGGDPKIAGAGGIAAPAMYWALTNPRNIGRAALASHGVGRAMDLSPQLARLALLARLGLPADEP